MAERRDAVASTSTPVAARSGTVASDGGNGNRPAVQSLTRVAVAGIGLWAPGAESWQQACALLAAGADDPAGGTAWPPAEGRRPAPALIPANERRRAPATVLLAVTVAEEACRAAGVDPAGLASVFASRYGDLDIIDYMCRTLAEDPALMSPTRFHNSVHNAASGYWSIATGARAATTATAAGAATFAHGLLEAASQARDSGAPVLLVAYDIAGTGPVGEMVEASAPFACALLLRPVAADRDPASGTTDADTGSTPAPVLELAVAALPPEPDAAKTGAGIDAGAGIADSDYPLDPLPHHPGLRALADANPVARGAAALLEDIASSGTSGESDHRDHALRLGPGLCLHVRCR